MKVMKFDGFLVYYHDYECSENEFYIGTTNDNLTIQYRENESPVFSTTKPKVFVKKADANRAITTWSKRGWKKENFEIIPIQIVLKEVKYE